MHSFLRPNNKAVASSNFNPPEAVDKVVNSDMQSALKANKLDPCILFGAVISNKFAGQTDKNLESQPHFGFNIGRP